MRCRLDARKRISRIDHTECALSDADAVQSDLIQHTDDAAPNVESVRGRAIGNIGEAVENDGVHCKIQTDTEKRDRKNSCGQEMLARNRKEYEQGYNEAKPSAARPCENKAGAVDDRGKKVCKAFVSMPGADHHGENDREDHNDIFAEYVGVLDGGDHSAVDIGKGFRIEPSVCRKRAEEILIQSDERYDHAGGDDRLDAEAHESRGAECVFYDEVCQHKALEYTHFFEARGIDGIDAAEKDECHECDRRIVCELDA